MTNLIATGQTAASPLLPGTWVLLQRFQFDHEASGDFVLRPLPTSGQRIA